MKYPTFDHNKAIQAINYLVRKSPNMISDKIKVMKLIWAADKYHLLKYGRPVITGEKYYAMRFGPVPSGVNDLLGGKCESQNFVGVESKHVIKSFKKVDMDEFSDTDIEALDFALSHFGTYDTFTVAEVSHGYPEWKAHENAINRGTKRKLIDYLDFFEESHLKNDPFTKEIPDQIRECAKETFIESREISSLLS